jgi:hypothetical protein
MHRFSLFNIASSMGISCAQSVRTTRRTKQLCRQLSPQLGHVQVSLWLNTVSLPAVLHIISVRLYPGFSSKITSVIKTFSPLSTPLIIRSIRVKKENYLITQRG